MKTIREQVEVEATQEKVIDFYEIIENKKIELIYWALKRSDSIAHAASILSVKRVTLSHMLKERGIKTNFIRKCNKGARLPIFKDLK